MDAMVIRDALKENSASVPLMVVENGCGSPCIDFRQVSSELAEVAKDADLVENLLKIPSKIDARICFYLLKMVHIIILVGNEGG